MNLKISKEFQLGLLVIVTIAVLFFGINYLKGINIFNPSNYYYAKFDRVSGLLESSNVTIKGYKVGLVKSINYNFDDPKDGVVVVMMVDDDLKVPIGSRAVLTTDLLGGATISLNLEGNMSNKYAPGDTIPAIIDDGLMSAVTDQIMPRIQSIVPQLDSLIISLRMITEDNSIQKTLGNINRMTANLENASVSINKILDKDVPVILGNVNTITSDFSKVTNNLSGIDFKSTVHKADLTLSNLQSITDKINSGQGSIGLLLNDKTFYNNLTNTAGSANELLIDLKANPKRYVQFSLFGKSEKQKKKKNENIVEEK